MLVIPDFGSIESLTAEITVLLDYFQDIFILHSRIYSPFYKGTMPVHSRNIVDIEYLVRHLKITKIISLGDSDATREFSKC